MNREKITTRLRPLLAGAAFSLLLVSGGVAPAFAVTPTDTLVQAWAIDDTITLDPAESFELTPAEFIGNAYDMLVRLDIADTTKVKGGVAESWTVSDDGLQYTFKLRPGVKFQTTDFFTPTRDMNADDVVFSFERQWKTDNAWNKYIPEGSWEYFAGMGLPENLAAIEKVNVHVQFRLRSGNLPTLF